MKDVAPETIRFWIETRLRDAVNDPEIIMQALAMLKVGHESGDPAPVIMQKILADFILTAFGVEASPAPADESPRQGE